MLAPTTAICVSIRRRDALSEPWQSRCPKADAGKPCRWIEDVMLYVSFREQHSLLQDRLGERLVVFFGPPLLRIVRSDKKSGRVVLDLSDEADVKEMMGSA